MDKNKLYKSNTIISFNGNISNFHSTYISKNNNEKIKLYLPNKTYKKFPKISNHNNSYSKINNIFPIFNSGRVKRNISFKEEEIKPVKNELSVAIFQNNDVELIRNLNPDSDKNLCGNLLLKEQLKNKIESNINISNLLNSSKKRPIERKATLSKIKINSMDGILENEKIINIITKQANKNKDTNLLEKDLNKKLKQINDISSMKKLNKIKIYDNFKKIISEIDNISYDIQLINQRANEANTQLRRESKIGDFGKKRRSSIKANPLNTNEILNYKKKVAKPFNNKNDIKDDIDKLNKFSMMQSLYKNHKKNDFERKVKQEKIFELRNELKQLKIPLKSINNEIGELKSVEKNIKQRLMRYYQELLYKGKEIRNEGLSWIIKAIWRLGENVPMSFMPTFLDFNAIKYLFNMARLSVELESKKKLIIEIKKNLREKINNLFNDKEKENNKSNNTNENSNKSNKNKSPIFLFKTDLLFKNKKMTNSSSQPKFMRTFYKLNENLKSNMNDIIDDEVDSFKGTFKEMSKIFEENENNFNIINMPAVKRIKKLEKKIKELAIETKNIKKDEIKRIFKEYIDNDYESKYHASIDIVLGALFGEQTRNIQVNNFNVFKKGYLEEIKNIRFYEYGKRKG